MIRASVVLPTPGGPQRMMERELIALDLPAQRLAGPEDVLLPDEILERAGPHALGQRPLGVVLERSQADLAQTGSRRGHPLLSRVIQRDPGGHRRVQRFDADGRNPNIDGFGAQPLADAAPFAADDDGALPAEVALAQLQSSASASGRTYPACAVRWRPAATAHPWTATSGHAEEGSGRGAQAFRIVGADRALEKHDTGGAERLGRAHDRAGVAGILQAIENHRQRLRRETVVQPSNAAAAPAPSRPGWLRWTKCCGTARPAEPRRGSSSSRAHGFPPRCAPIRPRRPLKISQSLRSASSSRWKLSAIAETILGSGAPQDGLADFFEQRISRAGERWHKVDCEDRSRPPAKSIMKWIVAIALVWR